MANMAPVINTRGPLFVHPSGIVKRTTFHVLAMYANLLEPNIVETCSNGESLTACGKTVPAVDAVVTCDDTRQRWAIALINRHLETAARVRITVEGRPLSGCGTLTSLTGDTADAYNDIGVPDRVAPKVTEESLSDGVIELPPHSISILRCERSSPM